jgi:hypothetical protein
VPNEANCGFPPVGRISWTGEAGTRIISDGRTTSTSEIDADANGSLSGAAGRTRPMSCREGSRTPVARESLAVRIPRVRFTVRWLMVVVALGIDRTRLTFRHNGTDRLLTDVHGHVIQPILA